MYILYYTKKLNILQIYLYIINIYLMLGSGRVTQYPNLTYCSLDLKILIHLNLIIIHQIQIKLSFSFRFRRNVGPWEDIFLACFELIFKVKL